MHVPHVEHDFSSQMQNAIEQAAVQAHLPSALHIWSTLA